MGTIKVGQCIYSQLLFKKPCKSDSSGMFWHILLIKRALCVTAGQIVCICWEPARCQWKNAHGYLGTANKKWRKKDLEEKVLNFNWNILSNMMNIVQPLLVACQFYMYKCALKRILYKLGLFRPFVVLNIDSGIGLLIKIMLNVVSTRVAKDTEWFVTGTLSFKKPFRFKWKF